MVEKIEEFRPELDVKVLRDSRNLRVLQHRKIERREVRTRDAGSGGGAGVSRW